MSESTNRLRGHVASYKSLSSHRQNCLDVCDEIDRLTDKSRSIDLRKAMEAFAKVSNCLTLREIVETSDFPAAIKSIDRLTDALEQARIKGTQQLEMQNALVRLRDEQKERIEQLEAACQRSLNWLASYPGGNAEGAYDEMRKALETAGSSGS